MAVYHLKYRPQKFSDLDSEQVSLVLTKVLASKDLPQSFLFSGPKGAGKTSAARILAKAVNCESPIGVEPCGECGNCKDIGSGNSVDIVEIDAASNRGIEDVRALKDRAYLLPSRLKRKVFIIDEVHMMTKEAFNALLKLIEEPPRHTIFVLCTTDPEKIPDTILSRLIRVDFKKGNKKELLKSLLRTVEGEGVEADTEALEFVAERSDGSFRNLQKTLNEVVMLYGKKIGIGEVKDFFDKKTGEYSPTDFETDLQGREVKKILTALEEMAKKGVDMSLFRNNLVSYFQTKLLACYGVIGEMEVKAVMPASDIAKFLNLLIMAGKQEKDTAIDQLPLQLAVVEFAGDEVKDSGQKSSSNGGERETHESQKKMTVSAEQKKEEKKLEPVQAEEKTEEVASVSQEVKNEVKEEEPVSISSDTNYNFGIEEVEKEWGRVLVTVKPFNHSVEAFLRAARPKSLERNLLTLEVFYPFHKDRLEEARNRKIVEMGLTKVFGVELAFECVLGKTKKPSLVIQNDTPMEAVSENLTKVADGAENKGGKDMYDVAKEIFG